jgi:tetratricopeptide (TPR) repeat protein
MGSGADRLVGGPPSVDEHDPDFEALRARVMDSLFTSGEPAPHVGRFTVIRLLGEGAMGRVYAAYDDELDRRVALKLMRRRSESASRRMIREAKALARLSHPNVVTVYEVGEHQERPFIAMEFVQGQTLAAWQDDEEHSDPEILEAYLQAGEGLAAAHAEGLVHRDFKPQNVMIEKRSGRATVVKVLDFGLVQPSWNPARSTPPDHGDLGSGPPGTNAATVSGTVVGTPAYMAPEQYAGTEVGPAADQFAYCVSLWEAVFRVRPFLGRTMADTMVAIDQGRPRSPGSMNADRRWLHGVLMRGLAADSSERYPSMDELLTALRHDPASRRRSRRRWFVLAMGGGALVLLTRAATGSTEPPCSGAWDRISDTWGDAPRKAVHDAFAASELEYAPQQWTQTEVALDEFADAWVAMHEEACLATATHAEQSARVLDLRMACLHHAKNDLAAAVQVLESGTTEVIQNAHRIVAALPTLDACADLTRLEQFENVPNASEREAVEAARRILADAKVKLQAGDVEGAWDAVEAAHRRAESIAFPVLHAELAYVRGKVEEERGEFSAAENSLQDALRRASDLHRWDLVRDATAGLIWVLGEKQQRVDEARVLRDIAFGASDSPSSKALLHVYLGQLSANEGKYEDAENELRKGIALYEDAEEDASALAKARGNLASVLRLQGRFEDAETEMLRVIETLSTTLSEAHPDTNRARGNLADLYIAQGKFEEARREAQRAVREFEKVLGPEHPDVATVRYVLGSALYGLGRYDEAEQQFLRVLDRPGTPSSQTAAINALAAIAFARQDYETAEARLREVIELGQRTLSPDHPALARYRDNLGSALTSMGRYAEAETEMRAALEARERKFGPHHPEVALSYNGLAALAQARGDMKAAEAGYRRALEAQAAVTSEDHPSAAKYRTNLANAMRANGSIEEAAAEHRIALEHKQRHLPDNHDEVLDSMYELGHTLQMLGRHTEAREHLERAWAGFQNAQAPDSLGALIAFALAKERWRSGDRKEARALVERAEALIAEATGEEDEDLREELEAWRAARR